MGVIGEDQGGRNAKSTVTLLGSEVDGRRSVVKVDLETGRTHQIRVHMQALRCPLLGDLTYGYKDFNRECALEGIERPMLHAWRLAIRHPHTGELLDYSAPIPDDMSHMLGLMGQDLPPHS